jgi:hypothetical protein
MTSPLDCEVLRELAPELALGGLTGPERAIALEHLTRCSDCQAYVEELAAVADRLLLLAPEDEPSAGLESRVLARINELHPVARRRRPMLVWLAAAAAILVGVAGGALFVRHADNGTLRINREYVTALQRLNGRSLRAAALTDSKGQQIGQAFVYDGSPSWVFVSVDRSGLDGHYMVVCTGKGAGPISWPVLRVTDGHGAVGWTANGDVRGLDHVQVVDQAGHTVYQANLGASPA